MSKKEIRYLFGMVSLIHDMGFSYFNAVFASVQSIDIIKKLAELSSEDTYELALNDVMSDDIKSRMVSCITFEEE